MGIGVRLESIVRSYRAWRASNMQGPIGDFYRAGGSQLVFEGLPVTSRDVVLDVGGYRGDWTAEMCWRYGCRALLLEPVPEFATKVAQRFEHNDRVDVVACALGASDGTAGITLADDGSSFMRGGLDGHRIQVPVLGVMRLFQEHGLDDAACAKINIEGAEYDLLDAMIEKGLQQRVRCFLIQFHDIGAATRERLQRARNALARSHVQRFCFDLVWERWDRPKA